MEKLWSDEAWDDYIYWQGQDKKTIHKINNLLKTSGSDEMKGKNLAVIGTYFQNQDAYKLVAVTLGAETNNKENKKTRPRRVEYNGFSFIITTYPDPILQKIHLYSIYSEEEQTVG